MRSGLQGFYERAPVWAQNLICTAEGMRLRAQRFPPGFDSRLRHVCDRGAWNASQRGADVLVRLRAMLVHAGRRVPYWRELFAATGFRPERLQHPDELALLPILTKDDVVREGARMLASAVPHGAGRAIRVQTSGSTGAGLSLSSSVSSVRAQWAVCWRYRGWHGLQPGTWCAQITGRVIVPLSQRQPPLHRVNHAGRQLLLSGYHLAADTAREYLQEIARRRIAWIHGYPSLVSLLCELVAHERVHLPELRWITLASESVAPHQRERIEQAFGVIPRQHYAQSEAVANASECPHGRLHVDEDFSHVELVAAPGLGVEVHRVIGTSLENWHQPFIRYETGDLVRIDSDDACACGRPGRVLRDIDGRREDYVVLRSGALVGRCDHIFKRLDFVREAQIRQQRPGAVEIHVVPRDAWTEAHERMLRSEARAFLGADTEIAVAIETALPRGPSGKLRLVVQERS